MIAGQAISAARIIIATGSETIVPPIEVLKEAGFITNAQTVALPALPSRLAVIGGGIFGLEFAQIFHRFGVDVTVLERGSTILDKEDRELAEKLCTLLKVEGIRLETGSELRIRHYPRQYARQQACCQSRRFLHLMKPISEFNRVLHISKKSAFL